MLQINEVSKQFKNFALSHCSFCVKQGEYYILLGESGVGKSLLLSLIVGIHIPQKGSVFLNNEDITYKEIEKRNIGLVFQNQSLFPHLSVYSNIAFGLRIRKYSQKDQNKIVTQWAKQVGVDHLLTRKPETLSGGEAQRVSLARALVIKPSCLLLDEPLSSLDIASRDDLRAILRRINREHGITIVHVTHDYEEALTLAERIGVMENGTIVQEDMPQTIFHNPKSEFIARFIGIKNFFRGTIDTDFENQKKSDQSLAIFRSECNRFNLFVFNDSFQKSVCVIIRSEDIVVMQKPTESSARNQLQGKIVDIIPAFRGIELIVDVGVKIAASVSKEVVKQFSLFIGKQIYIHIKASAIKIIPR